MNPSSPLPSGAAPAKRRLRVTHTETLLVDVASEDAERLLDPRVDHLDQMEAADEYRRQAHPRSNFIFAELALEDADGDQPWYTEVLDAASAGPGYLWSAWHFLGRARQMLSSGRYRDGHCPDLDRLNIALGRLEEQLRLMALEAAKPKRAAALPLVEERSPA